MHFKVGTLLIFISLATPAYAYLDPSTGSMFLQSFLAILAMAGSAISVFWGRIKSFFSKFLKKKKDKPSEDFGNSRD